MLSVLRLEAAERGGANQSDEVRVDCVRTSGVTLDDTNDEEDDRGGAVVVGGVP